MTRRRQLHPLVLETSENVCALRRSTIDVLIWGLPCQGFHPASGLLIRLVLRAATLLAHEIHGHFVRHCRRLIGIAVAYPFNGAIKRFEDGGGFVSVVGFGQDAASSIMPSALDTSPSASLSADVELCRCTVIIVGSMTTKARKIATLGRLRKNSDSVSFWAKITGTSQTRKRGRLCVPNPAGVLMSLQNG
jgi:hypothetical protein